MKISVIFTTLMFISVVAFSQIAPNTYVITFKDKENNKFSIENPQDFLTKKA